MATKILQIVGNLGNEIYTQNDEPTDAKDGALWVDLDDEGLTEDQAVEITANTKARHTHANKETLDFITPNLDDVNCFDYKGDMFAPWSYVKSAMPKKTSQLTNDSGFITADDLSESGTHTHANKEVIDKFGETNGELVYNNSPIGGKPKIKSITVANDWNEGQVYGQQGDGTNDGIASFLVMEDTWNAIAPAMVVGVDVTYLNGTQYETLPISNFLAQNGSAKTPILFPIPTLDIGLGGYEVLRLSNCNTSTDELFKSAFNDDGGIQSFTIHYLEIDYDTDTSV